jgi:hypothetical protein
MRIVPANPRFPPGNDRFLTYVQRFDIVPQLNPKVSGSMRVKGPYPDPVTTLYILKRAKRANQSIVGDVVPLEQLRALVELTPRFGAQADRRLTKTNSLAYSLEFFLDKYFDKEMFFALN